MGAEPIPQALALIKPPDTASLSDQIYQQLRHALMGGQFAPGTRMVETVIAERLGVSRTPLRDALNRLTIEGWLEARRNKGVIVAGIRPQQVRERYALRAVLEGYGVREAVARITTEGIDRLERICDEAERTIDDDNEAEFARLDGEMHEGLLQAAGNVTLLAIWRQFLHPTRHAMFALGLKGHRRKLIQQHRKILVALRSGDPDGAEKAIRQHLHYAMQAYLSDDGSIAEDLQGFLSSPRDDARATGVELA